MINNCPLCVIWLWMWQHDLAIISYKPIYPCLWTPVGENQTWAILLFRSPWIPGIFSPQHFVLTWCLCRCFERFDIYFAAVESHFWPWHTLNCDVMSPSKSRSKCVCVNWCINIYTFMEDVLLWVFYTVYGFKFFTVLNSGVDSPICHAFVVCFYKPRAAFCSVPQT